MIEKKVDLWTVPAQACCITTNGVVTKDGRCVMGRGVALQARNRFYRIDYTLGALIEKNGNRVQVLIDVSAPLTAIVSFPVKHRWQDPADLLLIEDSAKQLVSLTDERGWNRVVLPRPGCGNGCRKWEEVKPVIEPILDDRFLVVTL